MFVFVSGEDVHAEESFLFGGFCRNSDPLPVPGPTGGSGLPYQMVGCFKYVLPYAQIIFHLQFCDLAVWILYLMLEHVPLCDLS